MKSQLLVCGASAKMNLLGFSTVKSEEKPIQEYNIVRHILFIMPDS